MALFKIPVLVKTTHDNIYFWETYVEVEIEADSLEEAEAKALCIQSRPLSNHKDLLSIIDIRKYVPN